MPVCVCSVNNTAVGELIDKLEEEHNWDLLRTRRVSNSGEHRSITLHTSGGGSIDGSVSLVWLPAFLWQCSAQLSPGAGLRPTCVNGISKHFITSTRPMELILSTTAPILPNKVNMFQSKRTERLISHSQPMHYSAQYKLQQQGMYVTVS